MAVRVFVLCSLAAAGTATPTSAHTKLVSATPAADSMATAAPTELRLKFSERLELKFTGASVVGPTNDPVPTGPAALDPNDEKLLIVPLQSVLSGGKYVVDWHALSSDGHKTKGAYSFEVIQ
jgi:methionine-rich copper-binding protein CopC